MASTNLSGQVSPTVTSTYPSHPMFCTSFIKVFLRIFSCGPHSLLERMSWIDVYELFQNSTIYATSSQAYPNCPRYLVTNERIWPRSCWAVSLGVSLNRPSQLSAPFSTSSILRNIRPMTMRPYVTWKTLSRLFIVTKRSSSLLAYANTSIYPNFTPSFTMSPLSAYSVQQTTTTPRCLNDFTLTTPKRPGERQIIEMRGLR